MENLHRALLTIHIVAGFTSLILFWVPMFTRKGGDAHRKIGKWYVNLMWIVVVSAAILSVKNLLIGKTIMGAFLGFIAIITANPLYHGISILKNKTKLSAKYNRGKIIFNSAIVLASLAMIIYGIYLKGQGAAILMFVFGGLGLNSIPELIKSIKNPPIESDWLKDHLINMLTSGIAAYTAFLVFGANQFFSGLLAGIWSVIPWVAPTVIGTIGIRQAVKKYQKKSSHKGELS